jgi:probable F420-dependent oxidoreductase
MVTPADDGGVAPPPTVSFEGTPLRLGLMTPVLTMLPDSHASWEVDATIDDVAQIAVAADRLGYSHVGCSEHVVIPTEVAAERGSRYWDPLATFGYLAAVTTRVRFATNVLVLGYHHPLEIAKRYGTLDQVTSGRLILGVGVGSLREEFDLLGAAFDDRGARADDALRALRVSLSAPRPRYDGAYYSYADVVLDPCARQDRVPFWIGGRTARSLRRAVELGDGWAPFGLSVRDLGALIETARATAAWAARPRPLEIVLQNNRPVDPGADPQGTRQAVGRLVAAGATALYLRLIHHSVTHYIEQMEAMLTALA